MYGLLVGLMLMTLRFGPITYRFDLRANGLVVLGLMAIVWLFCGAILKVKTNGEKASLQSEDGEGFSFLRYSLVVFSWFLAFLVVQATAIRPGAEDMTSVIVAYYLFLCLAIGVIAAALIRGTALASLSWRKTTRWLYPFVGLGVAILVFTANLCIERADMYYSAGLAYRDMGRYDESISLYRGALQLAPGQDRYYLLIALDSLAAMSASSSAEQRDSWFEEARKALEKAREISPLDPDHVANLGYLYQRGAGMTTEPVQQAKGLKKALRYFEEAMTMSPHSHGPRLKSPIYVSHKNLAILYQQLGRSDEAQAEANLAKDLAPDSEKSALEEFVAQLESQGK